MHIKLVMDTNQQHLKLNTSLNNLLIFKVTYFLLLTVRLRVLLSMMNEDEVEYGPPTPFSYKDLFLRFFCSSDEGASDMEFGSNVHSSQREPLEPSMPESGIVGTVPKAREEEPEQNIAAINDTAEKLVQYQEPMHPDIMANVRANVAIEKTQMSATTA